MRRLIIAALALAAVSSTDATAIPRGFTRPPDRLFLICPTEPANFDRHALSQRSA